MNTSRHTKTGSYRGCCRIKTVVTGGAGYIGSRLVPLLLEEGHDVTVFDSLAGSSPDNLAGVFGDIEFVRGDVRDYDEVRDALEGVDAVIHLAAITGASETFEIREKTFDVNQEGTKTVLRASEEAGVDKAVFASSCNVYGSTDSFEVDEEVEPDPLNPYAEAKLSAEKDCFDSSVSTAVLRLSTNYGWSDGIRFNLVVNSFVFRALVGEPLTVYGDGTNWRPFMHVKDTARALKQALGWDEGVYNVGGDNLTINEVAATVVNRVAETDVKHLDRDGGPSYRVDFSKAHEAGYEPEYGFGEGVEKMAEALHG